MNHNTTIQIEEAGRGGIIRFKNGDTSFNLWWEFAGSDAIAIIEAPTNQIWESHTKLPLTQREEVLTCIAEQVIVKKISSGGYFSIGENSITIYAGKEDTGP